MLKISRLAHYATVAMHWLSQQADGLHSSTVIAEGVAIAIPTISKVMKLLNDAGLVEVARGVQGGYQLARSAHEISVAEIVTAVDGHPDMITRNCSSASFHYNRDFGAHYHWQYIYSLVYNLLHQITLQDFSGSLNKLRQISIQFIDNVSKESDRVSQ